MTTDFTFFEGAATVNSTTPRVTVRKTGQLVLTEAAVAMLGEGVEAVQIGFDPKARAVGIRPAAEGGRGVLKLRRQPNGRSRLIDCKRFFAHHGLTVEKARGIEVETHGIRRDAVRLEEPAPAADLVLVLAPRRPRGALRDTGAREGDQAAGPGREQDPVALGSAPMQVHGDVRTLDGHRRERRRVDHLVEGAGVQRERRERGRQREDAPVTGERIRQRPQRGNRREQVAEPQRAQREHGGPRAHAAISSRSRAQSSRKRGRP